VLALHYLSCLVADIVKFLDRHYIFVGCDLHNAGSTCIYNKIACLNVMLSVIPDYALIDGNKIPPQLTVPAQAVISGDALSYSIAAASVLAKVTRDRYMVEMDEKYPAYDFKKHKGYGTKVHREAILEVGPSPIHRMSFLKNILK
jgi:ribonuclease HII